MRLSWKFAVAALLAWLTAAVAGQAAAASIGRSSMPGGLAQRLGYGYGAGHHVPIVRTPGMHGPHVPRNIRVPRLAGPLYPAPYEPVGCYGDACYPAAPAPVLAPIPAMPTPAAQPPAFEPPAPEPPAVPPLVVPPSAERPVDLPPIS